MNREILIAVAWSDLILTAACRALLCLASGALVSFIVWAAWGIIKDVCGRCWICQRKSSWR